MFPSILQIFFSLLLCYTHFDFWAFLCRLMCAQSLTSKSCSLSFKNLKGTKKQGSQILVKLKDFQPETESTKRHKSQSWTCILLTLTGSHSATCLSLMRLKPVLRIFPSDTKSALTGLEPSWGFSFSCKWSRGGIHILDEASTCWVDTELLFIVEIQYIWRNYELKLIYCQFNVTPDVSLKRDTTAVTTVLAHC